MMTYQQFKAHVVSVRQRINKDETDQEVRDERMRTHKIILAGLFAELPGNITKLSQVPEKELWPLYQRLVRDEKLHKFKS